MRHLISGFILSLFLAAGAAGANPAFTVKSADIQDRQMFKANQVYKGFGCDGGNQSPQIAWSDAPAGTRSFAVTMYDPDAPTGSGFGHWVVYNIPASVHKLDGGAGRPGKLPDGAKHGRNDFGSYDYGGACPPAGDKPHRFILTVYALKVDKLDVPADASPAMIGFMLNTNRLATATLTGMYSR